MGDFMERINKRMSKRFGNHWVKVKFCEQKPQLNDYKKLENIRFCEAITKAKVHPLLLDKESISCNGARYAFGWQSGFQNENHGRLVSTDELKMDAPPLKDSEIPRVILPFNYIGLNLEGSSDLILSYLSPQQAMNIIETYNQEHELKRLEFLCCSTMAVCGCTAVRTYMEGLISISFGCEEARKYGGLQRYELAMGIPNQLYGLFMD
jgi:uncharacterized protein (DUF169 family)